MLMKALKKTFLALLALSAAFALSFSFASCSDGDDNSSSTPEAPKANTIETKGKVSAEAVTVKKDETTGLEVRTATLEDSTGGVYEFTEETEASSARAVATEISGTWVYKVELVIKFSGTYTGDISKIGTEATKLELKLEKTTNSIDEAVKVVEEKTFELTLTETSFAATVPEVVSGVLDLRIKGGNVATGEDKCYDPSKTFDWGEKTGDVVKTEHVTATVYENGIYFEVTRPEDECYKTEGLNHVAVYRIEDNIILTEMTFNKTFEYEEVSSDEAFDYYQDEDGNWARKLKSGYTVRNDYDSDGHLTVVFYKVTEKDPLHRTGFWPLCIKDKPIKFEVQIEPNNPQNWRQFCHFEKLTVTPKGGIGEIDYANLYAKKWLTAELKDGKQIIKFDKEDLELPNVQNISTSASFFAGDLDEKGNLDWNTNGATLWVYVYRVDGATFDLSLDDVESKKLIDAVKNSGKKQFAFHFQYEFDLPGCGNVTWKAIKLWSDILQIE